MAPMIWTTPARTAMNETNPVTLKPYSSEVKYVEARSERKSGDSPNKAMLVPEAMPIYSGKFFEAANKDEKYL